jgi:hypothetical protein
MGLLDRHPLEVSHPKFQALRKFLTDTYQTRAEVKYFALEAGVDLGMVDLDEPVGILWQSVAVASANQQKLRFLVQRVHLNPNSAHGAPLLQELLAEPKDDGPRPEPDRPPALTEAVFDTGLLWGDLPFIDRTGVRQHLKMMMLGPASRRALLVIGPEGAGKTYTRQFIHYLSESGGSQRIKPIDMSMRAGAPIDERELASLVAHTLVDQDPPTFDPTAQAETVVSRFVPWLADEVRARDDSTWLVLDGFTPTTATGGALHLVDAVARAAANRDLGSLRVVVLGYSGNPASAGLALSESLGHPTRDDVKVFFARVAKALQDTEPDDQALESLVDSFGPIDTLPLAELGPSALNHVRTVLGAAS